jgi:hypothetical protein
MKLTVKQRLFVHYYLADPKRDPVAAARQAGYRSPAMNGPPVLASRAVAGAVAAGEQVGLRGEEILARLAAQATGDIGDVLVLRTVKDEDGKDREVAVIDLVEAKRRKLLGQVRKLTPTRYGYVVEMYDAQAALVQLGKHLALFADRLQVDDLDFSKLSTEELLAMTRRRGSGAPVN